MNPAEAAVLLARISASDNREVSEAAARAWAESLPDVALADALEYLPAYYREASRDTRNWIYPGDVLAGVRKVIADRRRAHMIAAGKRAIAGKTENDDDVQDVGGLDMFEMRARVAAGREYDAEHVMPGAEIDLAERERRLATMNPFRNVS